MALALLVEGSGDLEVSSWCILTVGFITTHFHLSLSIALREGLGARLGLSLCVYKHLCPHPLADGNSFFGHGLRVGDMMLHDRLEQLIFILPVKRRLDGHKYTSSFSGQNNCLFSIKK